MIYSFNKSIGNFPLVNYALNKKKEKERKRNDAAF